MVSAVGEGLTRLPGAARAWLPGAAGVVLVEAAGHGAGHVGIHLDDDGRLPRVICEGADRATLAHAPVAGPLLQCLSRMAAERGRSPACVVEVPPAGLPQVRSARVDVGGSCRARGGLPAQVLRSACVTVSGAAWAGSGRNSCLVIVGPPGVEIAGGFGGSRSRLTAQQDLWTSNLRRGRRWSGSPTAGRSSSLMRSRRGRRASTSSANGWKSAPRC